MLFVRSQRVHKNDLSFKKIALSFREAETVLSSIRRKQRFVHFTAYSN